MLSPFGSAFADPVVACRLTEAFPDIEAKAEPLCGLTIEDHMYLESLLPEPRWPRVKISKFEKIDSIDVSPPATPPREAVRRPRWSDAGLADVDEVHLDDPAGLSENIATGLPPRCYPMHS